MSVPINERETTISFMRNSDKAIIYTSDKTMPTKLHKPAKKNSEWKRKKNRVMQVNLMKKAN